MRIFVHITAVLFFFLKKDEIMAEIRRKQECIPVGCVPAARCPYPGGGTWSRGGGVYLVPG